MNLLESILLYEQEMQSYLAIPVALDYPSRVDVRRQKEEPTPPPLLWLAWQLGDGAMLARGGVLNQPVGLWKAAQAARSIWDILKRSEIEGFHTSMSASDARLWEQICDARKVIARNGNPSRINPSSPQGRGASGHA